MIIQIASISKKLSVTFNVFASSFQTIRLWFKTDERISKVQEIIFTFHQLVLEGQCKS